MSVPYGAENTNEKQIREIKQIVETIKTEQDQKYRYIEKSFKPNKPMPKNTE